MDQLKPLPIGQSDFGTIIRYNFLYVDKTQHIYNLVKLPSKYFLSRPRRFGKSTLVSTFNEIFKGNKELFKDQWIYNSQWEWEEFPIIRLDFNGAKDSDLKVLIINGLQYVAHTYGVYEIVNFSTSYELILKDLIIKLYQKYNKQVVVLVDEYDKPILDIIEDTQEAERKRDILKGFYSVMKGLDEYLRFIFLTGVTKFSKVGVFSDLNNLNDISMDNKYSDICGITQPELEYYFKDYINNLANVEQVTYEECLLKIKKWYNGFYFSDNANSVYNPFSTLNLFDKDRFSNYWFVTGSPSFLIKLIKKEHNLSLKELDNIQLTLADFDTFEINTLNLHAILFQTGYLTIKNYNPDRSIYTLSYTNYEIEKSFKENLFNTYFKSAGNSSSYLNKLCNAFDNGILEEIISQLKQIFLNLDYDIKITKENHFQNTIYLIFQLLGYMIKTEYKTETGRIDAIIFADNDIYIFEFKINQTAKVAMVQIHNKKYYNRFLSENKTIHLLRINFNTESHLIDDYLIENV